MHNRRTKIQFLSFIFAIIGVGILVRMVMIITSIKKITSEINIDSINAKNNVSELQYKTYDSKGKAINISSEKAYETAKDKYTFEKLQSTFYLTNGELGTISANIIHATKNDKTKCEFNGNVQFTTDSGMQIKTEQTFADLNKKILQGNTFISFQKDESTLCAQEYYFDLNENILTLTKNAKGEFKKDKFFANKLIIQLPKEKNSKKIKKIQAFDNAKYISPEYNLQAKDSIIFENGEITANKNVKLIYTKNDQKYDIRSEKINAKLNEQNIITNINADGSLIIKTKDVIIRADKGEVLNNKIHVYDNVSICGAAGDILGTKAVFDIKTGNISIDNTKAIVEVKKKLQGFHK